MGATGNKRRIAYLIQDFYIGGIPNFLYNLSKKINDEFDIHFIATGNSRIHPHFYKVGKPVFLGDNWTAITEHLKANKIQLVQYGNLDKYRKCAINAGVPVIIERTAGPRSCNNSREGVTHVISSTKSTIPLIRKNYNGDISVIYNGVDLNEFRMFGEKDRLGFTSDDFIVLYSARYGRGQAFDVLINAVIEARKVYDNIRLVLIGGPPKVKNAEDITPMIKQWVKPLGNSCVLTGFLEDPKNIVGGADLYVSPAKHHGISNSVLEAMACGVPAISTNVGGMNEVINDGENGFLVKVGDVKGIADKIIKIRKHYDRRLEMMTNSRKTIEENFDLEKKAKEYRNLYKKLLKSKKVA